MFEMATLKIWADATKPKQPILVFASGFLTEAEIDQPLETWTEDIIRYATERNWNVAGVYWGAKNKAHILSEFKDLNSAPLTIVEAWQTAKSNIEHAAHKIVQALSFVKDQDIYLVGHSLGARLLLRVCELMPKKSIQKLVLMAPACTQRDFNFERIRENVKNTSVCLYSEDDIVLTKMFPFAESPQSVVCASMGILPKKVALLTVSAQFTFSKLKNKALGAYEHSIPNFKFLNASKIFEKQIGHLTYIKVVYKILNKLL